MSRKIIGESTDGKQRVVVIATPELGRSGNESEDAGGIGGKKASWPRRLRLWGITSYSVMCSGANMDSELEDEQKGESEAALFASLPPDLEPAPERVIKSLGCAPGTAPKTTGRG
jgi:hypothetical protein